MNPTYLYLYSEIPTSPNSSSRSIPAVFMTKQQTKADIAKCALLSKGKRIYEHRIPLAKVSDKATFNVYPRDSVTELFTLASTQVVKKRDQDTCLRDILDHESFVNGHSSGDYSDNIVVTTDYNFSLDFDSVSRVA